MATWYELTCGHIPSAGIGLAPMPDAAVYLAAAPSHVDLPPALHPMKLRLLEKPPEAEFSAPF